MPDELLDEDEDEEEEELLLLLEELLFPESAEEMDASVLVPAMPSGESPFERWKAETAASVLLP